MSNQTLFSLEEQQDISSTDTESRRDVKKTLKDGGVGYADTDRKDVGEDTKMDVGALIGSMPGHQPRNLASYYQ